MAVENHDWDSGKVLLEIKRWKSFSIFSVINYSKGIYIYTYKFQVPQSNFFPSFFFLFFFLLWKSVAIFWPHVFPSTFSFLYYYVFVKVFYIICLLQIVANKSGEKFIGFDILSSFIFTICLDHKCSKGT
jgi:hypothetical protein